MTNSRNIRPYLSVMGSGASITSAYPRGTSNKYGSGAGIPTSYPRGTSSNSGSGAGIRSAYPRGTSNNSGSGAGIQGAYPRGKSNNSAILHEDRAFGQRGIGRNKRTTSEIINNEDIYSDSDSSNDSDDTDILYYRIPSYPNYYEPDNKYEDNSRKEPTHIEPEISTTTTSGSETHPVLKNVDSLEENENRDTKTADSNTETDKLHQNDSQAANIITATENKSQNEMETKNISTTTENDKPSTAKSTASATSNKPYDAREFIKQYSSRRKKPKVSNNQTMVLMKVGIRYQYVTVPAYLPCQRLYRSSTLMNLKNVTHLPQPAYVKRVNENERESCNRDDKIT